MSNYGNNLTSIGTKGRLVFVDEQLGDDIEETQFDSRSVAVRDVFIDFWGIDGIYQPGSLNRAIKYVPKYIADDNLSGGSLRHKSPMNAIKVPHTTANGITAEEFEPNQVVTIAPRKGASPRQFRLLRIAKQSAAWVTFEVQ